MPALRKLSLFTYWKEGMTNTEPKHLQERDLKPTDQVEVIPEDRGLTHFRVQVTKRDETAVVASWRKPVRLFSASAALRFVRDNFGLKTATVHLEPRDIEGPTEEKGGKT